jgi:cell wall-associated NlpC family hydrolase
MRCALLVGVVTALVAPGAAGATTALVDVSVATLWKAPNLARSIDAPSLGNPVDPAAWSRNLATTESRVWLDSRVQTQALYGQRVWLLARQGGWAKVAVVDEPDPQNAAGYPGWLPARQLVGDDPDTETAKRWAVVTARTAWLTTPEGRRLLQLSFATRLILRRLSGDHVVVETPRRKQALLPRADVRVVSAHPRRPSGARVLAAARRFLGVRYLWGGLSAWGFDCSGIVWAAYRSFGVTIPRDADPQLRGAGGIHGVPVARSALRPGDLLFFGSPSYAEHEAIYAGKGRMLEAPDSAHRVRIVPVRWTYFVGARRY